MLFFWGLGKLETSWAPVWGIIVAYSCGEKSRADRRSEKEHATHSGHHQYHTGGGVTLISMSLV
jgi:hypothetical protein